MGTDTPKRRSRQLPVSRNPQIVTTRILDAAQAEFMAVGFERANTNRIVERLGGSKATLFRHFPTKQALMAAVIQRIASGWLEEIKWGQIESDDPEEWLNAFGYMALKWILRDENLFVGRTGIAEGDLIPEARNIFQKMASEPIQIVLVEKLRSWNSQKLTASRDPDRDAASFFDLVLAGVVSRSLYGVDRMHTPSRLRDHVQHTVSLFLRGVQRR